MQFFSPESLIISGDIKFPRFLSYTAVLMERLQIKRNKMQMGLDELDLTRFLNEIQNSQ